MQLIHQCWQPIAGRTYRARGLWARAIIVVLACHELVLKTAAQTPSRSSCWPKLTGEFNERLEINILIRPHWIEVCPAVIGVLEALELVIDPLNAPR